MSPHAVHWRLSCAKPSGIVASTVATSVTIMSAPHAKQGNLTISFDGTRIAGTKLRDTQRCHR
jgi:hypothetical protein